MKQPWAWWFPDQKGYVDFTRAGIKKPPPYPGQQTPTYCAEDGHYAWTVSPTTEADIIILCPRLFEKDVPDTLDLSSAEEGLVLDKRESRSLTWMHEMFHSEFPEKEDPPDSGKWVEQSADVEKRTPLLTKADNKPYKK